MGRGPFASSPGSSAMAAAKRRRIKATPAYVVERAQLESELSAALMNEPIQIPHPSLPNRTMVVPPLSALLQEKAKRSFREFVRQALPIIEPSTRFFLNWMTDAICDHCQSVAEGWAYSEGLQPADPNWKLPPEGPIRDIAINVPPRSLKSTLVAVLFPAWCWINWPGIKFMSVSFSHELSKRDSRNTRRLIESDWYQARWGRLYCLSEDSNTLLKFDNNMGGFRYSVSIGGQILGFGYDILLCDDMNDTKDIHSKNKRERVKQIWDDVFSTRGNNKKTSCRIIICQRSHDDDLTGHVFKKDKSKKRWVHLCIPCEFEVNHRCETRLPWKDPRLREGELICPERDGQEEIRHLKEELRTAFNIAAQLQQRPVPLEGGIFEHDWWRYYRWSQLAPISEWTSSCISVDMNFGSKSDKASYAVFQAWARIGAKYFLLGQMRGQWKFTKAKRNLIKFVKRFYYIYAIYVEAKANGPAIMDELAETYGLSGLIPVEPDGDKEARGEAVAPLVEAHNCYLPDPSQEGCGWVNDEFHFEVDLFPMAGTDDITDTMTQALRKLRGEVAFGAGSDDLDRVLGVGGAGSDDLDEYDLTGSYSAGSGIGYGAGHGDSAFNENGGLDGWSAQGFDAYGLGAVSTMNLMGSSGMLNYGLRGGVSMDEVQRRKRAWHNPEKQLEPDVAKELEEAAGEAVEDEYASLMDAAKDVIEDKPRIKVKKDGRDEAPVVYVKPEIGSSPDFWGF